MAKGRFSDALIKIAKEHRANHARIDKLPPDQRAAALAVDKAKFHTRRKKSRGLGRLTKNISRETSRAGKSIKRETRRAEKEVKRSAKKVEKEAKRVPGNIKKIIDRVFSAFKFAKFVIIGIVVLILFFIIRAIIR